jgi:UDP-glucose 4-epimerase
MTRGEQQRDFVFVDDVVAGLITAAYAPGIDGRALDLGTGKLHCVREVIERIWARTGSRGTILAGALPYRPGEVPAIPANVQRTRLLTGWEAKVSLDEGLDLTIEAIRRAVHLVDHTHKGTVEGRDAS